MAAIKHDNETTTSIDMKEKDIPSLIPDLIFEILVRTQIESLPTLRCVCKDWRNLLSQQHFINHHHQRSRTVCGHIFPRRSKAALSDKIYFVTHSLSPSSEPFPRLDFLPEPVKIEACAMHGLLCCVGLQPVPNHYVCKPTTREWIEIPKPRTRYPNLKIEMVTAMNDNGSISRFKIVRISCDVSKEMYKLRKYWEVFDSSTWKWTRLNPIKNDIVLAFNRVHKGQVVNGCFCCLANEDRHIMAFDLWREELALLKLPPEAVADCAMCMVSIDEDKLGLICGGLQITMWVLPSMVDQIWEKKLGFHMQKDFNWWGIVTVSHSIVDDILFWFPSIMQDDHLWLHLNLKDMTYKEVEIDKAAYSPRTVFFFRSNFFPCYLRKLPAA